MFEFIQNLIFIAIIISLCVGALRYLDGPKEPVKKSSREMDEGEFKTQFIASWLAGWCLKQEDFCNTTGRDLDSVSKPAVEDAQFLATGAWKHYLFIHGNSKHTCEWAAKDE